MGVLAAQMVGLGEGTDRGFVENPTMKTLLNVSKVPEIVRNWPYA